MKRLGGRHSHHSQPHFFSENVPAERRIFPRVSRCEKQGTPMAVAVKNLGPET
jgi:hypothetical protein